VAQEEAVALVGEDCLCARRCCSVPRRARDLPDLGHVLLPGTFRWTQLPHPRVAEHMDVLRSQDTADLIRHFKGLEPTL
jgi:hypothetical protein